MKEGTKSPAQLHAERKLFVEQAMQKDALGGMKRKKVDIGLMYVFNDELTLAYIARQVYPQDKSGRANASLQFKGFITTLFDRVAYALDSPYELEDLLARKPRFQEFKEGSSENQETDVNHSPSAARANKEKLEQLTKEEDDKKIQIILDELPFHVIVFNMKEPRERKKRRNPRVFTTIGRAVSDVYRYKFTQTHLFAQDLENNGIPNRKLERIVGGSNVVHYVLLEKHRDRALAAWEKDPRLEMFKVLNPVTMVCGNKNMDIPSVNQLFHDENFRLVSSVLSDLGIQIPSRLQIKFGKWLFKDCPVTVWQYQKGRYVAASDVDLFKQYFLEKSTQLRKRVGDKT